MGLSNGVWGAAASAGTVLAVHSAFLYMEAEKGAIAFSTGVAGGLAISAGLSSSTVDVRLGIIIGAIFAKALVQKCISQEVLPVVAMSLATTGASLIGQPGVIVVSLGVLAAMSRANPSATTLLLAQYTAGKIIGDAIISIKEKNLRYFSTRIS